ncbi:thioredoxin family protein [candidate division KSB1 bacterium]|nr:thioredoxin family protein [candidate division KSB1 bacterium]NIT75159.1 thioredoxin family protein [candidate division KSB1 bacterium]NIW73477.1 hypothetical protein [candidate division KSB1 bacterium]NIX74839.1 hypothetical protein [candidate division KSB1 bacterium]
MQKPDWKKYIGVFIITAAIFATALYVSNALNEQRMQEVRAIEDKIAIDLLSSETQYALLQETICSEVNESILSSELNALARRLEYGERSLSLNTPEFIHLKKYYSLLEIKDYLLMKKLDEKCGTDTVFVLYFYSNEGDCPECKKMGPVLTHLREKYPELRVYSFDYHLDLSAVRTLTSIYELTPAELPAIILNSEVYSGFRDSEEMEALLPDTLLSVQELKALATSTPEEADTGEDE